MSEQQENIERVSSKITRFILVFWQIRIDSRRLQFHVKELLSFVASNAGVAPDSPGRIMRLLKQAGTINYRVVNRRNSLYEIVPKPQRPAAITGVQEGLFR